MVPISLNLRKNIYKRICTYFGLHSIVVIFVNNVGKGQVPYRLCRYIKPPVFSEIIPKIHRKNSLFPIKTREGGIKQSLPKINIVFLCISMP